MAKAQGRHLGRPKATYPEGFIKMYTTWKSDGITAKKVMQELSLKPTTFYKLVKEHEGR